MTSWILILSLVFSVLHPMADACSSKIPHLRSITPKQTDGIPPCLIPPFDNLVYQFEGPVKDQPRIRTGCYTKSDAEGTPFPVIQIFPLEDSQPLRYYVIDGLNEKKFVSKNTKIWLQLPHNDDQSGTLRRRLFSFNDICFPKRCYSDINTWATACKYPFIGDDVYCDGAQFPCDDIKKAQLRRRNHLGHVSPHDTWMYCQSGVTGQLNPIMTWELPFGHLQHLKRKLEVPNTSIIEYQGPRIVLSLSYWEPDGTVPSGCDIVFPLQAPFNTYEQHFWYYSRDKFLVTIRPGETGVAEKWVLPYNCLEWEVDGKVDDYGQPLCAHKGRLLETFTFDDFCFPQECYMVHRPFCTGKAGNYTRSTKKFSVAFKPDHTYSEITIALNSVDLQV